MQGKFNLFPKYNTVKAVLTFSEISLALIDGQTSLCDLVFPFNKFKINWFESDLVTCLIILELYFE